MDTTSLSTEAVFDPLPPLPTSIEIGGEPIEISPLRIGELPAFARAIRPFAERMAGEVDWTSLIADHGEAVLQALSVAARRPYSWVEGLTIDEAIRLADSLLEVNADPRRDARVHPDGGKSREPNGWARAIQRLIGAGHRYPDVLSYTVRQCESFLAAADTEERARLAELVTLISVGTHGGRDAVERLLKDLQGAD